jgi:hypothetical protein
MAARSFHVQLRNFTGLELDRAQMDLAHGEWSDNGNDVPVEHLGSPGVEDWSSESDGAGTGTEGSVTYNSPSGSFTFFWDNPFVGSNSFSVQTPPGFDKNFGDISGDNANTMVILIPAI